MTEREAHEALVAAAEALLVARREGTRREEHEAVEKLRAAVVDSRRALRGEVRR